MELMSERIAAYLPRTMFPYLGVKVCVVSMVQVRRIMLEPTRNALILKVRIHMVLIVLRTVSTIWVLELRLERIIWTVMEDHVRSRRIVVLYVLSLSLSLSLSPSSTHPQVMSTPQNPDAGGWIIRNYAPAETCNVTCQSGYRHDTSNPTSSYMRCMIDYACDLNSISLGNCTSNVAPSGGPYLVDATANTETSFPEYVCTENSCAAITMPTGAISASGLGSNIIMCSAELVLNTNTFPTQCLITCDAGYVYKLGALLCPADSDHNASVTTNTGESEFTCQPVRILFHLFLSLFPQTNSFNRYDVPKQSMLWVLQSIHRTRMHVT